MYLIWSNQAIEVCTFSALAYKFQVEIGPATPIRRCMCQLKEQNLNVGASIASRKSHNQNKELFQNGCTKLCVEAYLSEGGIFEDNL